MNLIVRNLVGGYDGKVVVNDVSFEAKSGDMIYVLGPNGSGKTTMFNMIIGYNKRISGEILIENKDVESLSSIELAKCIAYIPQEHIPSFNYTVEDIVIMGRTCHIGRFASPKKEDYDIAHESLSILGIEDLLHREYMELSGGERKLVLISRALCQRAKIIIMDEPLTGLDFSNKAMVTKALNKLTSSGHTILMSTHNAINNYSSEDKILLVDEGGSCIFDNIEVMISKNMIQKAYKTPLQTICSTDENGGKHLLYLPI